MDERSTRVTFIMTGQISKHEYPNVATNAQKNERAKRKKTVELVGFRLDVMCDKRRKGNKYTILDHAHENGEELFRLAENVWYEDK